MGSIPPLMRDGRPNDWWPAARPQPAAGLRREGSPASEKPGGTLFNALRLDKGNVYKLN